MRKRESLKTRGGDHSCMAARNCVTRPKPEDSTPPREEVSCEIILILLANSAERGWHGSHSSAHGAPYCNFQVDYGGFFFYLSVVGDLK